MSPAELRLLGRIRAMPGLHLREYARASPETYQTVATAAQALFAAGLVRREGRTAATRYYPTIRSLALPTW